MYRIGFSEDIHPTKAGRKLVLGGVEIPYEFGLDGHSDADVVLHSLSEAILGALALGDLGDHFPDNDPKYKGISSILLLNKVVEMMNEKGYKVNNVDGFNYAYTYPGMNKVMQAVGRLIRTESDRGAALLIDERYMWNDYKSLFKKEWSDYEVVYSPTELKGSLQNFFKS